MKFQVFIILEFLGLGRLGVISAAEDVTHPFGRDSNTSHEPKRPQLRHLEEDPFGREVMTPPVRKRTQLRHWSSVGASKENQVGQESERYDPFMGIKRDLRFDRSLSLPKPTMSPSLSFSMAQTNRPTLESCPFPCDDDQVCAFSWPDLIPLCYPKCLSLFHTSKTDSLKHFCSEGDICVHSTFACEGHADVVNGFCECSAKEPGEIGNYVCSYSGCGETSSPTPAPSSIEAPVATTSIPPTSDVTTLPGCVNVELTIESDNVDDVVVKFSKMPEDSLQEEFIFTTENKFSAPLSNEETNIFAFCLPKGKYLLEIPQGDVSFSFKTEGEEVVWGGYYGTTVAPEYEIFLGYEPPMDETDKEWLEGINQRRKTFHEENGVSYRQVVWSPHLKELSDGRAQSIVDSNCTIPQDSSPEGQTIYALITVAQKEVQPVEALEWQFEQQLGRSYNYSDSGGHGYLRQMVWRSSRYVGCDTKVGHFLNKDGAERHCHASVCYYARAGNCDITEENWLNQTLADRTRCGPPCGGGQIGTGEDKGVTGCY